MDNKNSLETDLKLVELNGQLIALLKKYNVQISKAEMKQINALIDDIIQSKLRENATK